MYISKHRHMLIVPSQHNNVSLLALGAYWYEEQFQGVFYSIYS